MLKEWRLATRYLVREFRAGQWLVIFFALVLAVATITSIKFFTDRLQRGLDEQSASLLGGDIVVSSATPIPVEWLNKTKEFSLRTAEMLTFPSVITGNNQLQLVNVQAVSDNYPLFGTPLNLPAHTTLVEYRLLPLLAIHIGDSITIGAANFLIGDIAPSNLDLMNTGWVIAPSILIRQADVSDTKVVIPGSRVNYRLLIAGEKSDLRSFIKWLSPQLAHGQRILTVENQRFMLLNILHNTDKYIQLVVLFTLLMCGTAITLSVRQHLLRHYEDVALWRCLGAEEKQITAVFTKQLLMIALLGGLIGIFAGYCLHLVIIKLFYSMINFRLPAAGMMPIVSGLLTSLILLFCYAYPIISTLPRISPLFLWRQDISKEAKHKNLYAIITLVLLLSYVYWMMDFSLLALFILDSLLLAIGFLYLLNIITFSCIKKLIKYANGPIHRGLSQFIQYPETASIQLTAFTLLLMSLIILSSVKHNLLGEWQLSLPPNTPNYFAFNIAPYEITDVKTFFKNQNVAVENIYPMVRGRLQTLNGKPILDVIPTNARDHNTLHRELNLGSMINYPSDNKIISGKPWNVEDNGKAIISVESQMAAEMHLKIGDELGFQIGSRTINAVISNIRSVDWASFHPNFYIIFPPDTLEKFPATYISSFHLAPQQSIIINQLVKDFPSVTVIDIATTLHQIQGLLNKATTGLQYLFIFTLCSALLIFITSLTASMDERKLTYRLLRILGASRNYITSSLLVEFSILAGLTILFAYGLSYVISQLLMRLIL